MRRELLVVEQPAVAPAPDIGVGDKIDLAVEPVRAFNPLAGRRVTKLLVEALDELFEAGALQEVAARTRAQRRDEVVFVFGGRDDDDLDVG